MTPFEVLVSFLRVLINCLFFLKQFEIHNRKEFLAIFVFFNMFMQVFFFYTDIPALSSLAGIMASSMIVYAFKQYHFKCIITVTVLYRFISDALIIPVYFTTLYQGISIYMANGIALVILIGISYFFVKFLSRYFHNVKDKYWLALDMTVCLNDVYINILYKQIMIQDKMSRYDYFIFFIQLDIFILIIFFLSKIDRDAYEIYHLHYERNLIKYREISYSMIQTSQKELEALQHQLTYVLMQLRQYIQDDQKQAAIRKIDDYSVKLNKKLITVLTGNPTFDTMLSLKISEVPYSVSLITNIQNDPFYDDPEMIRFCISLLENCKVKKHLEVKIVQRGRIITLSLISDEPMFDLQSFKKLIADCPLSVNGHSDLLKDVFIIQMTGKELL